MSTLQDFSFGLTATGGWVAPVTSLLAAFVFGQLIAWAYERTYHGLSYSRGFSHALVLVCLSAAILVLAMSHSVLAGLGLFGVLSMIRFRTDLKTPRDLVFVMGAACVGVGCGVGAFLIAGLGAGSFAGVAFYLAAGPFGSRTRFDAVLRFRLPTDSSAAGDAMVQLLGDFCRRQVLLSATDLGPAGTVEHVYQIKFHRRVDPNALLDALRGVHAEETRLLLQDSSSEY